MYELFRGARGSQRRTALKYMGIPRLRSAYNIPRRRRGRRRTGRTRVAGFFGRFRQATNRFAVTEMKFHDLDVDDAAIAANGTIVEDNCCGIAQGVTEVQRIGRKCTIRSINWRFRIELGTKTAAASTADIVRVILYLDKQCNGATAAITDLLETDDFQSFNNLANKSRFRTLMDRTYEMNSGLSGDGTTVDSPAVRTFDSLFKKVNIPIEFDATTGAITKIRSNNIGILILSESGQCSFASKMRLRFSDV